LSAPSGDRPLHEVLAERARPLAARATPRRRDAAAWALLGLAVVIYAVAAMVMTRGAIPQIDGLVWMVDALAGFDPGALATPHNGHPLILTRLIYTVTLRLFGPDEAVIEAFTVLAVASTAILLFLLLRKRVEGLLAVVPPILVLFLGTTTTPLDPNITAFAQSTALGLGALLALERKDRLGDVMAFVLLLAGVLTFTVGLAFAVGAAVLILAAPGWRRRLWTVAVPLVVFAVWYVWSRKFDAGIGSTSISNLKLTPSYAADSLAAGLAAVSGLDREFVDPHGYGLIDLGWGRVFAAVFAGVALWAVARGRFTLRATACAATLIIYWTLGALAQGEDRYPESVRYVFVTVVLCAVIAYELIGTARMTRWIPIGLVALVAFSLPTNVDRMRYTGIIIRQVSAEEAAEFTAIELQRDRVAPGLHTSDDGVVQVSADAYLELADRFGSLATPADELPGEIGSARARADAALGTILTPSVVPAKAPAAARTCREIKASGDRPLEFVVPTGGALLKADETSPLVLRRFGDEPTIEAGSLEAGHFVRLDLPADASSQPWKGSAEGATRVRVCRARP
jgi:hypothetical protein